MSHSNYRYFSLQDDEPTTNPTGTDNILIWLDEKALDSTSPNTQLMIDMLKSISNINCKLYNSAELFLAEANTIARTGRVILVTSGWFAERLFPELSISLLRAISVICIFCKDSRNYQYLQKRYRKIVGVFTEEQYLKEAIEDELNPSSEFFVTDQHLSPHFVLSDDREEFKFYKQYIELLQNYPWTSDNRKTMLDE
ncbi:unnamed protein product, partial [Adineta ricciae]